MSATASRSTPFAAASRLGTPFTLLALASLACSAPATAPPRAPAPVAAPSAPSGLPVTDWGEVALPSVPAVVTLPDHRYWRARERGTFVELEHAASGSRITLRLSLAPRLVRPRECEAEVRLSRPDLPRATPETELEHVRVDYPRGFDAELSVGVEPDAHGARGHATLVAAATGRCLFVVFESVVSGPEAAAHVADRLTVAVDDILPRVRLPSVDARAGFATE
jgi:hypothetical protein